jgi:hypothetical protein
MGRFTVDRNRNGPFYLKEGGKMNHKLEVTIQKQIRRRAFKRADILRQERQGAQKTQHTLDALQEVTGLHRSALESIAAEVRLCVQMTRDDFFSVRNQILITAAAASVILILAGFVYII